MSVRSASWRAAEPQFTPMIRVGGPDGGICGDTQKKYLALSPNSGKRSQRDQLVTGNAAQMTAAKGFSSPTPQVCLAAQRQGHSVQLLSVDESPRAGETRATAIMSRARGHPHLRPRFVYYHIVYLKSLQSRHHLEGAIPVWGYFY